MSKRKPVNYQESPDSSIDKSFESLIKDTRELRDCEPSFSTNTLTRNTPILKKQEPQEYQISKLKKEILNLKEIIQNLELQCQLNGIIPVTKGGSLKKRNKTEEKIQEIEAITKEIKKCLGIDMVTETISPTTLISPKTVVSPTTPLSAAKSVESVESEPLQIQTKQSKDFQKSDSEVTLGSPKDLEEMSSELMNMFTSFGF